jgi:PAS domain S-box-containing protein
LRAFLDGRWPGAQPPERQGGCSFGPCVISHEEPHCVIAAGGGASGIDTEASWSAVVTFAGAAAVRGGLARADSHLNDVGAKVKTIRLVFRHRLTLLLGLGTLIGLLLARLHSYVLFHSLAELFSVVVAGSIFVLAWNSRRFVENSYLLLVGIAYLFVGSVDLIHTLAYKGMNGLVGDDPNPSTQLWIAGRYLQSTALLIAPFFIGRRLRAGIAFAGFGLATALLLASIFVWKVFPACFIEGVGLTPFKKVSEYAIALLLALSIATLLRRRSAFDPGVLWALVASIIVTIGSELAFTLCTDVYGALNLVGHYLKLVSFYLIYQAILVVGLRNPYALVFRELKQNEAALRRIRDELELRIKERTGELAAANAQLVREIEEREQAEARTAESEAHMRTVTDAFPALIAYVDRDLRYRFVNATYEKWLGVPAARILGQRAPEILGEEALAVRRDSAERALAGEKVTYEAEVPFPDGRTRHIDFTYVPDVDEKRDVRGFFALAHDITDRRQAEQDARELRESLSHVTRVTMAGELAASIAHELNQPLTAILSNAQAAQRFLASGTRANAQEVAEALVDIAQDAERAGEVIRRLHGLLRKGDIKQERLDLNRAIREVTTLARNEAVLREVAVELDLADDLPLVSGDRIQLQQVVLNLVMNACEAMSGTGAGARELRVETRRSAPGAVQVSIRDSGPGIDENSIDRIFEPFVTTKSGGMGMGLSISRSIVEAHGGELRAAANPDRGSTFAFSLPIHRGESG